MKIAVRIFVVLLLAAVLLVSASCRKSEKTKVNEYSQIEMIAFFEESGYYAGVLEETYIDEMGISGDLNFAVTVSKKGNHHAFIYSFKTADYAETFYSKLFTKSKKLSENFVIANIDFPEINDYFK